MPPETTPMMQQYLRMRKALKGISDYKIPDIITWQSMQK